MSFKAPIGTIYLSRFKCIYQNLALEEWLFRNHDLNQHGNSILLWSNGPAVVIGRHQNPWLEVNLPFCEVRDINVARRFSGGGAVYHDLGNLNISVLTSQKDHNRPANCKLLADELNTLLGIQVERNSRDDLELPGERKISGTAARIAMNRAYHHMTLLVDTDLAQLKRSLRSRFEGLIETNATRSTRAKAVGQLSQDVPGISTSEVRDIVTALFAKQFLKANIVEVLDDVEQNETLRPGCLNTLQEISSSQWTFGKTPKFTLRTKQGDLVVEKGDVVAGPVAGLVGQSLPHDLDTV